MISVVDMEYNNNQDSTPEVVMINVTSCVTVSSIHLLVGAEVNGIHRLIGVGARNVP